MKASFSVLRGLCRVAALLFMAVIVASTSFVAAQDRRGPERGPGPRREEGGPRRESMPPAKESDRDISRGERDRSTPPERRVEPPAGPSRGEERGPGPRRDAPPAIDRRPERETPPADRAPRREIPVPDRGRTGGDDGRPSVDRTRPPVGQDRSDRAPGTPGVFDRGPRRDRYSGEASPDRNTRPGEVGSPSERRTDRGQETYGRVSPGDRGERTGPLDRGPRAGDRVGASGFGGAVQDRRQADSGRDRAPRRELEGSIADRRAPAPRDVAGAVEVRNARPYRDTARDIFTRSEEGRRYERGLTLRPARPVPEPHFAVYFPHRYCYYPYYSPTFISFRVVASPYHFYFGVVPGYVYREYVFYRAPRVVYIEVPVYVGGYYRGYVDDDYYLSAVWWRDERNVPWDLRRALEDLEDAFRYSNIDLLARLTEPGADIAVFTQGRYQYSLRPNDYLDMTRDFMVTVDTVRFDVFRVKRRSYNVYTASAKHVYRSPEGSMRTVYLTFALERSHRNWIITQIDTSPERL